MNDQQNTVRSLIVLINLDAEALFERLKNNYREYMQIFGLKRTREHFKDVFKTRYYEIPITDLKNLGEDLILALDKFYRNVDELKWYLNSTEDMPAKVEDFVAKSLREMQSHYDLLKLYLEAELGHVGVPDQTNLVGSEQAQSNIFETSSNDPFKMTLPE